MDESERSDEFKVTDRRRFTTEGETKGASEGSEPESPTEEPPAAEAASESTKEREQPHALPPLDFSSFVVSLANTVLFQLGFVRASEKDEPVRDLPGARRTIDLMAMLEEKTRGNLTDEEKKLLTETLFQLRMAFVEAAK